MRGFLPGAHIAVWWLPEDQNTLELPKSACAFLVPLPKVICKGIAWEAMRVILPFSPHRIYLQNNSGFCLPKRGNSLELII